MRAITRLMVCLRLVNCARLFNQAARDVPGVCQRLLLRVPLSYHVVHLGCLVWCEPVLRGAFLVFRGGRIVLVLQVQCVCSRL